MESCGFPETTNGVGSGVIVGIGLVVDGSTDSGDWDMADAGVGPISDTAHEIPAKDTISDIATHPKNNWNRRSILLFPFNPIGRTAKSSKANESFVFGLSRLTVGHILEKSMSAPS
jgi:hypothetical protein